MDRAVRDKVWNRIRGARTPETIERVERDVMKILETLPENSPDANYIREAMQSLTMKREAFRSGD